MKYKLDEAVATDELRRAWREYVRECDWLPSLSNRSQGHYWFGFKAGWTAAKRKAEVRQTVYGIPGEQLLNFEKARRLYETTYWANERLRSLLKQLEQFESGLDAGIPVG